MNFYSIFILFVIAESASDRLRKLNVLLIIIDDLRPIFRKSVLPILYDQRINLPNIQKLAGNGVSFNNAFAQQALCAPSRHSLLTGRRPDALKVYDAYTYWRKISGNYTTIPQYFKQNGYHTHSVGKVFHPGKSSNFDDRSFSWTDRPYHPSTNDYKDAKVCPDSRTGKLQQNLFCPVTVADQPEHTIPDIQTLHTAVAFLKRNLTEPYFLAVGFHKPHIPFKFPIEYLDDIPISKVKKVKYPKKPARLPAVAWHPSVDIRKRDDIQRLNISFPWGIMPTKWALKIRRGYFASAIYIDSLIGSLMKFVDTRNTVVVLTSDHGWSLGENGLWAKYSNFDTALKVPLIFNMPSGQQSSVNTPVELIDIFPTLVELASLPKVKHCKGGRDQSILCHEGKSLVPLMKDSPDNDTSFAISQYPRPQVKPCKDSDQPRLADISIMGYSIRTDRYRYTQWISFNHTLFTRNWNETYGVELYDHISDPYEHKNLKLDPQYKHVKQYLSQLLQSKIEEK